MSFVEDAGHVDGDDDWRNGESNLDIIKEV